MDLHISELFKIILFIIALGLSAFLSSSETAIFSLKAKDLLHIRYKNQKAYEIIQLLLAYGANPGKKGHENQIVLQHAIEYNRNDIVKIMVQAGADLEIEYNSILDDFNFNYEYNFDLYKYMLAVAIWEENIQAMKILLEAGADPNFTGRKRCLTPLQWVAGNNAKKITDILLTAGAKLDFSAEDGESILNFHSSDYNYIDGEEDYQRHTIVEYLLEKHLAYLRSESELQQQQPKKQRIH